MKVKRIIFGLSILSGLSVFAQTPVLVQDIGVGVADSHIEYMTVFDNQIIFAAHDSNGTGLWKSNSVAEFADTIRIINRNPYWGNMYLGGRIYNESLPVLDTLLIFPADDNIHGNELWVSDGTFHGTKILKDIYEGSLDHSSSPAQWDYMVKYNDHIYFSANNPDLFMNDRELWSTNGSGVNTIQCFEINLTDDDYVKHLYAFNDGLIFSASDEETNKLWYSNGTLEGTIELSDSITNPNSFATIDSTVYFRAMISGNGWELFKTNGTLESTKQVKEINPGSESGNYGYLVTLNNKIIFHGNDGIHGTELWKSDGTEEGTAMIKDIWVGSGNGRNLNNKVFVTDNLVYFAANDSVHGIELWRSDGTKEGTYLLKEINPSGDGSPGNFAELGGYVYFSATTEENGRELWVTDGTKEGTKMLFDINKTGSAEVRDLVVLNDVLFFTATTSDYGRELYKLHPVTDSVNDTIDNTVDVCNIDYNRPIDSVKIISFRYLGNHKILLSWEIWQDQNRIIVNVEYNFNKHGRHLVRLRVRCGNHEKSVVPVKGKLLKSESIETKSYLFLDVYNIPDTSCSYAITDNQSFCDGNSFIWNQRELTEEGIYIDTLIAGNGCDSIVTLNLEKEICTVRNVESEIPVIKIFPNPANDCFSIQLEKIQCSVNVVIYNQFGQSISDKLFYITDRIEMELNQPEGIYIIKIIFEDKSIGFYKLIVN